MSDEALYLGLDLGSTTTKAVLINGAGEPRLTRMLSTGPNLKKIVAEIVEGIDLGAITRVVATGYGRKRVPFADQEITEISCHARGVHSMIPEAATVIDIGGQDSKVIRLGPKGRVLDFVMNDRCAAGTGAFLEQIGRALLLDLDDLSRAAVAADDAVQVSSTCTVFAQTEVVHLVSEGIDEGRIARGVFSSIVERILPLVRRVNGHPPFALSGGVATLPAFAAQVGEFLGGPVLVPDSPQLAGALGAALIARDG